MGRGWRRQEGPRALGAAWSWDTSGLPAVGKYVPAVLSSPACVLCHVVIDADMLRYPDSKLVPSLTGMGSHGKGHPRTSLWDVGHVCRWSP